MSLGERSMRTRFAARSATSARSINSTGTGTPAMNSM